MDENTCANPACGCTSEVEDSFCSADCETAEGTVGTLCECGHSECHQAREALIAE